jgi:succinoglycan biosynthesis transport protein ExoP
MPNDFDEFQEQGSRKIEDYWKIVVRQRWTILAPVFLSWVVIWSLGWLLPSHYRSDAVIQVEQQKVPEHFVLPNVTLDLSDRVQSMTQQILSRTRLQANIDRFHLYPPAHGLKRLLQSGDPVEQMRKDIKVEVVESNKPGRTGQPTAFKITYTAGSPELAQQINSELTSLFINENLKSQQQLSEKTTAFLNMQLEDARAKLEEQEDKVRAFKAKHLGDLPSQLESNVQILSGIEGRLQSTQRALDAAKQERLYLESLLQQYQAMAASGSSDTSPEAMNKELTSLRLKLADARSKYSDKHPDVIALTDKIKKTEALKKQIADDFASVQKSSDALPDVSQSKGVDGSSATSTPMMQMQSKLKSNRFEIENLDKQQKSLESQISSYQARLNLTPSTEQELADISRGYEESKANYTSLLQKQNQSQLATSLEQRQQGEQFSILDPPSLPDKPSDPNHLLVSLGGLGVGLTLALGLVFLREFIGARVQSEGDLECVPAKLLVAIPRLSTPGENRMRMVRSWIEMGTVAAIAILILAGNLYAFYKG